MSSSSWTAESLPEIKSGAYLQPNKIEKDTKFRILSAPLVGWVYYSTAENKKGSPVRSREKPKDEDRISPANGYDSEKPAATRSFYAFIVYNYVTQRAEIMDIQQISIQRQLKKYVENPDWGNPLEYDITLSKDEAGKYTLTASPHKPPSEEVTESLAEASKINLEALLTGDNPFGDA